MTAASLQVSHLKVKTKKPHALVEFLWLVSSHGSSSRQEKLPWIWKCTQIQQYSWVRFSSQMGFFSQPCPLCKATRVTMIRVRDWAQGRASAGSTFLRLLVMLFLGRAQETAAAAHKSYFCSPPTALCPPPCSHFVIPTSLSLAHHCFFLSVTPHLYFLIPPPLSYNLLLFFFFLHISLQLPVLIFFYHRVLLPVLIFLSPLVMV